MRLVSLHLHNYRNYKQLECAFSPGINLINGANGQGKTNLVEAVYYLSIGKAYRAARDEQLVLWGEKSFTVKGEVEKRQGHTEIEISYKMEEKHAKTIQVDGLRRSRWEDVSGALTSVLFSPESMAIIKGSPQERRTFLNDDISQISLTYSVNLRRYRRILAQRNALLKNIGNLSMPIEEKEKRLFVWDEQLIDYGEKIIKKRLAVIEKLSPLIRLAHRRLADSKENLGIRYSFYRKNGFTEGTTNDSQDNPSDFLRATREAFLKDDLRLGSTQWGPHRDDIRITIDGVDTRQYGSQGQQRTAVLAIKLAELELFRGESGEYPVLLLDDVMSELDSHRQQKLLNFIYEKYMQCVITATEAKKINLIEKRQYKRFFVNTGEIKEL